jgi:hypothetical protein
MSSPASCQRISSSNGTHRDEDHDLGKVVKDGAIDKRQGGILTLLQ